MKIKWDGMCFEYNNTLERFYECQVLVFLCFVLKWDLGELLKHMQNYKIKM